MAGKAYIPARPQKGDEYKFTLDEKQVLYYRLHPVEAVSDIFGIQLIWLQRRTFRNMWFKRYVLLNMGRGVGKTFLLGLYVTLRALLYPGERIGILAPVFRQAGFVFDEVERLFDASPYLRASLQKGKISRSTFQIQAKFLNGSMVEGLPLGDGSKVRGRRYSTAVLDEYAQLDESIIKLVIRPMLNIKLAGRENRLLIASTAYYKWNHYWGQYVLYNRKQKENPMEYHVAEYDYRDVLVLGKKSPYRIDLNIIEMQKSDSTEEEFAMENLCKFPDESVGFFNTALIDSCTPRAPKEVPVEVELKQPGDNKYVIAVDCARTEGGDNFAMVVLKLTKRGREIVRVKTMNGQTYPHMSEEVRRTLLEFPGVIRISLASKGGGTTLKDLLAEPYFDKASGEMFPSLLDMDDEAHQLMEGTHIVYMVEETAATNHAMYHRLKSDMQNKKVYFPIDIRKDKDKEFEVAAQEIVKLKREMQVLRALPKGMYMQFEPAEHKYRKDRVTALVLANTTVHELEHPELHANINDLAVGFYVR